MKNPPAASIDEDRFHLWPAKPPCHAIDLDSCAPFEHIAVKTRRNDYDVVVLPGHSGDVWIRGGRFFQQFRRARVVGATFGRSAIRVKTIEVGCPLELHVEGTRIVTSIVEAVSRMHDDREGSRVM
jgi:hypothetical protein